MNGLRSIKDAAQASGLSGDTIRYYERIGVLPPVSRLPNTYRSYTQEHIETLRFARRLRELGLSPPEMTGLIRIFHDGSCREMRDALLQTAEGLLERVHARRIELEHAEAQLELLTSGLRGLNPNDHRLLTVEPCDCVALVGEGDG